MQVETKKQVYGVTLDWHPTHPGKHGTGYGYGNPQRYVTFTASGTESDFAKELKKAVKRQLEDKDLRNYSIVESQVLSDVVAVQMAKSAVLLSRLFQKGAIA